MFKKIILAFVFLMSIVSTSSALEVEFEKVNAPWGAKAIYITYDEEIGKNQNWIGIYRKGDSNNWENVIGWAWVKDLTTARNTHGRYYTINLREGTYDIRLFLNNSFDTFASFEFETNEQESPMLSIANKTDTQITLNSSHIGESTWIGIYKEYTTSDWENVKAWTWVHEDQVTIDLTNLPTGQYKARLFYNNSYTIENHVGFAHSKVDETSIEIAYKSSIDLTLTNTFQQANHSSWIGIYKKGTSNAWENVIGWKWATKAKTYFFIKNYEAGTYEARLFYNNSYDLEAKEEIIID